MQQIKLNQKVSKLCVLVLLFCASCSHSNNEDDRFIQNYNILLINEIEYLESRIEKYSLEYIKYKFIETEFLSDLNFLYKKMNYDNAQLINDKYNELVNRYMIIKKMDNREQMQCHQHIITLNPSEYAKKTDIQLCFLLKTRNFIGIMLDNMSVQLNKKNCIVMKSRF